jgi:predicted NBD/HSP70 family sugar kinase
MLEINPRGAYAIGVEMDATDMTCILTDFKLNKLSKQVEKTTVNEGKDKVIERLIRLIKRTIELSDVPKDKIVGVGLVSAGPYNYAEGVMINPPNFPGWNNVRIKEIVQQAIGIPTYFEKEIQGSAIAEYWFGKGGDAKSLFAIGINERGVGGGVVIDGHVYHGFFDGAGDLGHMIVDIDGPICACGSYGCLETFSTGFAMAQQAISRMKRGEESALNGYLPNVEEITIDRVVQSFHMGDSLGKSVIENGAKYLGLAIANIINIYSPEIIVIGRQVPEICPEFVGMTADFARKRAYPLYNKKVQIIKATFGDEQHAYGGAGIVCQEFFNHFSTQLSM